MVREVENIRNPYPRTDHHQKLISYSGPTKNHNTKFQSNRLIAFAVILRITDIMNNRQTNMIA